jgi:hypothetical protein
MEATSAVSSPRGPRVLPAILVGGLAAGALDLASAFYSYGWGVPRAIAGGLLGPEATQGGTGTWILGVFLHFFITCVAAAVYYAASLRLPFLRTNWLVCGLFFGIAVFLVMNLIVLPLSALHSVSPRSVESLIQGLLVHMFLVGLPISFSLRYFSR